MATFKIVVQHQRPDGFYVVYIRLIHNRRIKYIKTDKMVTQKGLESGTKNVKDPFVVRQLSRIIADWTEHLNKVQHGDWDIETVTDYLLADRDDVCFSDFARTYIDSLSSTHQENSQKVYRYALASIENFACTDKLMFSSLNSKFVEAWIQSLDWTAKVKCSYPICIRKIFRQAVKEFNDYDHGIMRIKTNPWVKVTIPKMDPTTKKAITMEECRRIFSVVPPTKSQRMALDVCKMVLCLGGINTADLFRMKKEALKDGILHYERAKTRTRRSDHAYIEMRIPDMLMPTVSRYLAPKGDPYLFNFHSAYSTTGTFASNVNSFFKQACVLCLGMDECPYTPYTFRHTWATVAKNDIGASYEEIAFALNHVSAHKVTMGYVKPSFERVWQLNEKVVERIFFTNEKSHTPEAPKVEQPSPIGRGHQLRAWAYFQGQVVAEVQGSGFPSLQAVAAALAAMAQGVPGGSPLQVKVLDCDTDVTHYTEIASKAMPPRTAR